MPLVRLEIRNEFGLGVSERHFAAAAKPNHGAGREDSKVVLDGLAVSGLVGILRQLGDLAEFAAEVFHGLQEQVSNTSSRSHNLVLRVQRIEAALPPLEKAVLAQTSHIHFAYTPGSEWHPRIRCERNLFIRNDLPHFIMDSYEECRGPPRLHLLDKFDTGGSGSCLKRYSDPTFFKKVSAMSDEANTEKAQKDRKARRTKKKRSSKQSGDVSRCASIMPSTCNYSSIPPSVDGRRSSSSQTASTVDPGLKYDLGDSLNSFGSRAELGYIECVFRPSSSKQAEEQEPEDSSSFNMVQHNDDSASVSREEHAGLANDSFPRSFLKEQMTSTSSCVTWDEKTEIMEPETRENGVDEILISPRDETEEADDCVPCGHGISLIVQQMETLGEHKGIEESSVSSQDEIDEIDSEPDNYLDALNTIESESENDLDSRMKRGLDRVSSASNIGGADGMDELTVTCSDHHAPKPESHTESLVSSNQDMLPDQRDLILSEGCGHEQMIVPSVSTEKQVPSDIPNSYTSSHGLDQVPHVARESSQDHLANVTETSDVPEGPASEHLTTGTSFLPTRTADIQDWSGDIDSKALSNISEPRESTTDVSSNSSVKIWTNGGLLGLMPSKPPDFSMASPVNQDSVSSCKPNLVSPLDSVPGNSSNLYMQYGFTNSRGNELKETSMLVTGKSLPVDLNVKYGAIEANQENGDDSSLVFGLSRRLLSNSFGRKLSGSDDRQFEQPATVGDNVLDQKIDHPNPIVPEKAFKEQFGYGSTVSPTASPPLEHMKISFHPVEGFEVSKLMLKFSDGTQSHEKTRDTFPSFHLIPEATNPRHDCNSDSDDDTFCRSSPFMSDDCLSRHSDSNSEQWEYGDEPTDGLNDNVYDALCGVSSMRLVPRSLELDGMPCKDVCFEGRLTREHSGMCVESSICSPILDLPSFDAVKPVLQQETDEYSQPHTTEESSPMPPPLPPMQWRASKPDVDEAKEEPDLASEAFEQVSLVQLPSSSISRSPDLGPKDLQHTSKEPVIKLKSKKERNHSPSGPGMDENDFLQQIRAKSFNLRRTAVPEKSSTACGPAANVNVTAILEKASAIRQAVGSDDDTWSDT